jgi:hypothetical protein
VWAEAEALVSVVEDALNSSRDPKTYLDDGALVAMILEPLSRFVATTPFVDNTPHDQDHVETPTAWESPGSFHVLQASHRSLICVSDRP